jgi:hypothetical protein
MGKCDLLVRPLDEIVQWLLQHPAHTWPNETPVTPEQLASWQNDAAILGYLRELTTVDLSTCPLWSWVGVAKRTLLDATGRAQHLSILLDCMPQLTSLDVSLVDVQRSHDIIDGRRKTRALVSTALNELTSTIGRLTSLRNLRVNTPTEEMSREDLAMFAGALNNLKCLTELKLQACDEDYEGRRGGIPRSYPQGHSFNEGGDELFGSIGRARSYPQGHSFNEGGEELFGSIGRLTALQTLHLPAFGPMKRNSPAVARSLAGALCGLKELVDLDLRYHKFCLEGATALANAIQSLSGLTSLSMGTAWGDEDVNAETVAALTAPLSSLTSLKLLGTYNGPVNDESFHALAAAISRMPALTCLHAHAYSGYGPDGVTAIARALRGLSGLTDLKIPGYKLGAGCQDLRDALLGMSSLEHLDIDARILRGRQELYGGPYNNGEQNQSCVHDRAGPLWLDQHGRIVHADFLEGNVEVALALRGLTSLKTLQLVGIAEIGETLGQRLKDVLLEMSSLEYFSISGGYEYILGPEVVDWGIAELGIDSIPEEILQRGWIPTLGYVRKISTQGGKRCGMLRLLIVGMAEVGKTCLRKAILSDNSVTEEIALDDRTIGIDTDMWRPCDDLDFSVRIFFLVHDDFKCTQQYMDTAESDVTFTRIHTLIEAGLGLGGAASLSLCTLNLPVRSLPLHARLPTAN